MAKDLVDDWDDSDEWDASTDADDHDDGEIYADIDETPQEENEECKPDM